MPDPIQRCVHAGRLVGCEVMEAGGDSIVHKIPEHVGLVRAEGPGLGVRGTGVDGLVAGYARLALIRRAVANTVAVLETVVVRTSPFKCMVEA